MREIILRVVTDVDYCKSKNEAKIYITPKTILI